MKHPDTKFVESIVQSVLDKRRWSEWHIRSIQFQFFPSQYHVIFFNGDKTADVALVTELFDDVAANPSLLNKRKIKSRIRQVIAPNDPDE